MDTDRLSRDAYKNFSVLSKAVTERNGKANIEKIKQAYEYAKEHHKGVKRISGEPFFVHPLNVAFILLENNIADTTVIKAALLHDTIEDTEATYEEVKSMFGIQAAKIVEQLTKIDKSKFESLDEYKSENLRKIILATAKDVRVMFVKLADRLHNMRTLGVQIGDKQKLIAKQTLKVYAPIAEKLGLYKIKSELEDLAFLYLNPEMYQYLSKNIELTKDEREKKTLQIVKDITKALEEENIKGEISGRAKHYYSIYKKIIKENKTIDKIYDLYGIRIIVSKESDCYAIKHILEQIWEIEKDPATKKLRIKDFIQNPKANGYQSLHINFRVQDKIIEVQIRTSKMNQIAESGVAKHWKYKENERDKKLDKKIDLLRQALAWKLNPLNKKAAENFRIDIFGGEMVCITPRGDPIILKENATPLDFAYSIHTKIGDHFDKAYVNGKIALINQKLQSGDIVNIVTSKKKTASKQWMNYVVTNEAKTKLRQSLQMTKQKKPKKKEVVEDFEELQLSNKIEIIGKQAPLKLSKCCGPKFGEEIVGFKSKDKKISVHRVDCPNRYTLNQKNEVKVNWVKEKKSFFFLYIAATDESGILGHILDVLLKKGIDVTRVSSEESKRSILISLKIKKESVSKIESTVEEIKEIEGVLNVNLDV